MQVRRNFAAADVAESLPLILTRDELYDVLHLRLASPPRRLSPFERDGIAQAAAMQAASDTPDLPFRIRPGLVAEILRFYDHLRRQSQQVRRFEELITEALGGGEDADRGADRMLRQTRFLARAFREYERRAEATGACDEHVLRDLLIAHPAVHPLTHIIVTMPDWIADPSGLFLADFDLLARIPLLASLDIVVSDAMLGSGFHERIHNWWPGLEEVDGIDPGPERPRATATSERPRATGSRSTKRPVLVIPEERRGDELWFTYRDREEELMACARRLAAVPPDGLNRSAIVFKKPLPYLYLAPDVFGREDIPYHVSDALPLAAEPAVAAVDLVLDVVETTFARSSLVALLRSPHFRFGSEPDAPSLTDVSALDRALSDARYLGDLRRLEELRQPIALAIARELSPLVEPAPASVQLARLHAFLASHFKPVDTADPLADRELSARAAVMGIIGELGAAHGAHHDPEWPIDDLAAAVRRWIGDQTFAVHSPESGVHLVDDQTARYGTFDDVTIVGLVDNEWPERPRRNIFYPPTLLKALGWPSEKDRRGAADARFLDLLASPRDRIELSMFALEDEALVTRSLQLDEIPRAKLSTVTRGEIALEIPPMRDPAAAAVLPRTDAQASRSGGEPRSATVSWAEFRHSRSPASADEFHGAIGKGPDRTWSVSALETYLACPFKFFAQHVLRLEEEPDDEEVMDPRRQGQFVHEVFETFFREWSAAGRREITPVHLDAAREMFAAVVDRALEKLPVGEAGLERTRLLGSSAAAGLGDAVFRMEAERPIAVVERLLEHMLTGSFRIATERGDRVVQLKGKADRLDLLADGTFRLIDYKLGWAPDRGRALQLPIYGICAEQKLAAERGRMWTLGEAVYLAFKGPKRVVPLFGNAASRSEVLAKAQQRLADTMDAIAAGQFPPRPVDVFMCDTCSFAAVCRKDYVGDV